MNPSPGSLVQAYVSMSRYLALTLSVLALYTPASAQDSPLPDLQARHAAVPPKLDGILDDAVWSGDALPMDKWVSYNPMRGEPALQRTSVWVAYDEKAIYVAFRCYDTDPDKIRTTIARRDNAWNDDWVAVSLDSSRTGQVAYHMFVNPSGVQMDALNSGSNGEDTAPDWVWQSAGKIDNEGYVVEMRLPLESIRFRSGTDVRMGIMFFRRISRLGVSWSWPEMAPGQWVFETHVPVMFSELRQPRLFEVIPSATFSRNQTRITSNAWPDAINRGDMGVSVKYGVTSTVTLDTTINPDFSQVESDAFEIEVNQRFPVFFSEKRPFFMEGLGLFNLAGTGYDSTMRTAVHTRHIIDPGAGVKLTGTAGRQTFALLSATDQSPLGEKSRAFTIGRGTRNFGPGEYAGILVTDTEFRNAYNRVGGGDIALRHGEPFRWNASFLSTYSGDLDGESKQGIGTQGSYNYSTRRVNISGQLEHYDRGFQMDTAFINRVGITRGWQYGEYQFYPDKTGNGRVKRIAPFVWINGAKDRLQGGTESFVLPGIRFNFTRQGNLRLDFGRGHETFAGQRFTIGRVHADGGAQFLRWLNVYGSFDRGPGIFYDPADPFGGTRTSTFLRVTLQPNRKLNHNLTYSFADFSRRDTGAKVYDVHVVNLRNTYQFNRQFLIRVIAQLDTSRHRVLGDFLASYELVPGTVVHLGYGSLLEQLVTDTYRPVARAVFFKASYLARF
jgi:Domain of unknown function (DUF5916)/Carbohydrate family 9 binding domain-like